MARRLAAVPIAALVLAAGVALAVADPVRGAGSSGAGDGGGMGQDNSEAGTPRGPGDKAPDKPASADPSPAAPRPEEKSPHEPGMVGRCDDGRPAEGGACPR